MSYRRQKRWWNAYILFYERLDAFQHDGEKELVKSMQDLTVSEYSFNITPIGLKYKIWQF